jgi:hypothetical protein
MYFLNAEEFHLPICWIWISEAPEDAAVVAAPIRKLCVWYECSLSLQASRHRFSWVEKNTLDTGVPSMKENSGSHGDKCFLASK